MVEQEHPVQAELQVQEEGGEGAEEIEDSLGEGDDGRRLDAEVVASVLSGDSTVPGVPAAGRPTLVELLRVAILELALGLLPVADEYISKCWD